MERLVVRKWSFGFKISWYSRLLESKDEWYIIEKRVKSKENLSKPTFKKKKKLKEKKNFRKLNYRKIIRTYTMCSICPKCVDHKRILRLHVHRTTRHILARSIILNYKIPYPKTLTKVNQLVFVKLQSRSKLNYKDFIVPDQGLFGYSKKEKEKRESAFLILKLAGDCLNLLNIRRKSNTINNLG